jgi:hypothetical protein
MTGDALFLIGKREPPGAETGDNAPLRIGGCVGVDRELENMEDVADVGLVDAVSDRSRERRE